MYLECLGSEMHPLKQGLFWFVEYYLEDCIEMLNFIPPPPDRKRKRDRDEDALGGEEEEVSRRPRAK